MAEFLFRSVRITDNQSPKNGKTADVLISGGKISRIASSGTLTASESSTTSGGYLSPGWVDSRVHLTDPGFEWKDDLRSLSNAAAAGGFTRIVCLPDSRPAIDSRDGVSAFCGKAENFAVHLNVCGCLTVKSEGKELAELYDMHLAGAVAFTDGNQPMQDSGMLLRGIQYLKPFGGLAINFPLDMSMAGNAQLNESPVSLKMGIRGIPANAEEMMVIRDLKLLEYFEGKLHISPVTSAGPIEQIRKAKKKFPGLSAGTTIAHLVFSDEKMLDFNPDWKLLPPLRPEKDVKALRKALLDGSIDVIASGHQPQAPEDKVTDFFQAAPGMVALETCVPLALTWLPGDDLSHADVLAYFTKGPRKVFGFPEVSIEEGSPAELTHFDFSTWKLSPNDLRSKSRNTPLIGSEFAAKVLGIFSKGKYRERNSG